uniref:Probable membrane transporter protein n=1 Tax=Candidatus Methanophaga sp. ANME-1 ERB7 TaxID=2759913 RepID=A0A7G9Z2H6_9EURY|nr:hypothetical protein NCOPHCNO_00011 [Methanosarcinales archaeon ANME-1 ERB7]
MTGGQLAVGQKSRNSVGITTLAEVPICMGSFISYYLMSGFSDWPLLILMTIGALAGAVIGPNITRSIDHDKLKIVVGALAIVAGIWILYRTYLA